MNGNFSSPAKYRYEDRVLFLVVPLFFLGGILGFWGFLFVVVMVISQAVNRCRYR
jgi:hypothetical protein